MNVLIIILRVVSLTCLASTLICGLYLAANKDNREKIPDFKSSVRFHKGFALVTIVISAVAVAL